MRQYQSQKNIFQVSSRNCNLLLILCCLGALTTFGHGSSPDKIKASLLDEDIDLGKPVDETFASFKEIFQRKYKDDAEDTERKKIFAVNAKLIKENKKKFTEGKQSFYLGVNEFADLTLDEFLSQYTANISIQSSLVESGTTIPTASEDVPPGMVDWRTQGLVTGVKNQGQCGSCWAFSATGSLEGQHKKKTGNLLSFSEQQLVDCSYDYGNAGCNGGQMNNAFKYINNVGGIERKADYPYVGQVTKCNFKTSLVTATVSGYVNIPKANETSLQHAVATVGPVSVAIDASFRSIMLYKGGVYDEPLCSSYNLNHGMLVVGYGTSTSDYWLVKNSWGAYWGTNGYILMSRNKANQCGIATMASYPLV